MPTNPLSEPAALVPLGQVQSLDNPPSQAYLATATVAVCLTSATFVVWVRVYVNLFVSKPVRWDDALIFLSWLGFIAYSVIMLESINYGSLVDLWNLRIGTVMQWGQLANTEELVYNVLIVTTKLSVLLLYLRAFVPARSKKTWVYYAIIFTIIFNALYFTAAVFVSAFSCTPRAKIWNPTLQGTCINIYSTIIGSAALNVLSDFLMSLIPMVVIWRLQMSRKRKVEVSIVFMSISLGLIASIARLVSSIQGARDPNQTVALIKIALWTFAEITACFLASCVPMFPPLMRHIRQKLGNSEDSRLSATKSRSNRDRRTNHLYGWPRSGPSHTSWSHGDEPYLMQDLPPGESEQGAMSAYTLGDDIVVETTVNISSEQRDEEGAPSSVPKVYMGFLERPTAL